MKKHFLTVLAVSGLVFTLAGCSSNYVMHTNDGRTIVTQDKPEVDEDTGLIRYKDSAGLNQQINRMDVKDLTEVGQ